MEPTESSPHAALADAPLPDRHASIQAQLAFLLILNAKRGAARYRVATGCGVVPEQWGDRRMRVADVAVTAAAASSEHALPEPLVLFTIMSQGNEAPIHADVWAFKTIPSVVEIVVVDAARVAVEQWRRGADGEWPEEPEMIERGGRLAIERIGFDRSLHDVYETTDLLG
jgi:hypothetical protein